MRRRVTLGVDVGTSTTKGVPVDREGTVLRSAIRERPVDRPHPGHVEMDGRVRWEEFASISPELVHGDDLDVTAVGPGTGPCVLLTDGEGTPLRPAILYGVDTRATCQIAAPTDELGEAEILERCGSALTTQAVGPKLRWVAENEPDVFAVAVDAWNPAVTTQQPDPAMQADYDEPYSLYRELYTSTVHALAAREQRMTRTTSEEPR